MQRVKLFLIKLIVIFYVTSSFLSATHFHADGLEHNDCKVCIVHKNLNIGDAPEVQLISLDCCPHSLVIYTQAKPYTFILLKGFNSNAPPHIS